MDAPHFSVVIPVYNRAREVRRALDSCLAQDFGDYEVVVVDDASTDQTYEVVRAYERHGVRYVPRRANGGEWAARGTGVKAAQGEWIVGLDSDHELLPRALSAMHEYTSTSLDGVHRVGCMARYTDGRVTPYPPPAAGVVDQYGFRHWLDTTELHDCIFATRRQTFAVVPWPVTRASGILYQLEFSTRFQTRWVPRIVATIHTDASNRMSQHFGQDLAQIRQRARDELEETGRILHGHGAIVTSEMPRTHGILVRNQTIALTLLGERRNAIAEATRQLRSSPASALCWASLLCAVGGRRAALLARTVKWYWTERRRIQTCRPHAPIESAA